MSIDAAVKAFRAGKHDDALQGFLAAWRKSHAPALATAIAWVGQAIDEQRGPIPGKRATRIDAWKKANARSDPADVGRLIAALDGLRVEEAEPLLDLMLKWPADPRTWDALFARLESPPVGLRGRGAVTHWQQVIAILEGQGEPRTAARREALVKTLQGGGDVDPHRHLPDTTQTMLEVLKAARSTKVPAAKALSAKDEALLAGLVPAAREDLKALFAKVYAAPDDDGARQILADALLESGDARGELINLQLAPKQTADQRKRAKQLLDANGKKWLGPLEPAILKTGFAYRRGFPFSAKVSTNQKSVISAVMGRPEWNTFEALDVESWPGDVRKEFVSQPLLGLKRVWLLESPADLPDRDVAWEEVSFRYMPKANMQALFAVKSLPKLKVLGLDFVADGPHPDFWKCPIAQTVTRIEGHFDVDDFVNRAPPNVRELKGYLSEVRRTEAGIEGETKITEYHRAPKSVGGWFLPARDQLTALRVRGETTPEIRDGLTQMFKRVPIEFLG